MVDPGLVLALALAVGGAVALAPWPSAAAAVLGAAVLRLHRRPLLLAAALVLVAVGTLRGRATLAQADMLHASATELLEPPARCEARGIVAASPVVFRRKDGDPELEAELAGEDARVDVDLESLDCAGKLAKGPLRARLHGAPRSLGRGDRVELVADLAPVHLFHQAELADPRAHVARTRVVASGGLVDVRVVERGASTSAVIDSARSHVRGRIEATFHPEAAPLARALVLGETDLDARDDEAFRVSGLAHLLAVSGTHLVIAVLGFTAALRALLLRVGPIAARWDAGRFASAAGIPAAWLYADFSGNSGSAVRAAAMLSAGLAAHALGRRPSAARTLAFALAYGALVDPLLVADVSFALSAAATAGLLALQRPVAALVVRGPDAAHRALALVAATLAAMIGCAPVLLLLAPTLPLFGVAANVLAAPVGELVALPVCLAHALLGFAPAAERGAAFVGGGALLTVRAVARLTADHGAVVSLPTPTAWQLGALCVAIAAAWVARSRPRRLAALAAGAAAWLVLEVGAMREGAPRDRLRVTVLDVGQGDAVLVDLPDGSAMLVDGGGFVGSPVDPGTRVILPVLRARRRSKLDVVVISHPHPDHFGGLVSTVAGTEVGELWDTGQGQEQGAGPTFAGLIASVRARGIPVRGPGQLCGAPRRFGEATVEILAPCPGFEPDRSANDNSFVLRVALGERAALLAGDAEEEEEAHLLAHHRGSLRADLLKVGHHGSRTSTGPDFLRAVSPSLAAVSCGVRNRFGHPHPRVLGTLAEASVPLSRTDRGGAVVWETDGREVRVTRAHAGYAGYAGTAPH